MSNTNPLAVTVVTLPNHTPRVLRGLTSPGAELVYVQTFDGVPEGYTVRFDHVHLYADVGDSIAQHTWTFTGFGWYRQ